MALAVGKLEQQFNLGNKAVLGVKENGKATTIAERNKLYSDKCNNETIKKIAGKLEDMGATKRGKIDNKDACRYTEAINYWLTNRDERKDTQWGSYGKNLKWDVTFKDENNKEIKQDLAEAIASSYDSELDLYIDYILEDRFQTNRWMCQFASGDGGAQRFQIDDSDLYLQVEAIKHTGEEGDKRPEAKAHTFSFSLVKDIGDGENHIYKVVQDKDGHLAQVIKSDCLIPDGAMSGTEQYFQCFLDELGMSCVTQLDYARLGKEGYAQMMQDIGDELKKEHSTDYEISNFAGSVYEVDNSVTRATFNKEPDVVAGALSDMDGYKSLQGLYNNTWKYATSQEDKDEKEEKLRSSLPQNENEEENEENLEERFKDAQQALEKAIRRKKQDGSIKERDVQQIKDILIKQFNLYGEQKKKFEGIIV